MQLSDLRTEVYAHGIDPTQFGASRVTNYLNSGQSLIARRSAFYVEEASQTIATTSGTATFTMPTDIGKLRELVDTDRAAPLQSVPLKYVDASVSTSGTPQVYAIDGLNIRLYPTPDGVHNLLLRYWKMPADLVNDTDVPNLPVDFHDLLWMYAVALAYKSEDDFTMGQQWMNDFTLGLSQLQADLKFINGDAPTQAQSCWDTIGRPRGWTLTGG